MIPTAMDSPKSTQQSANATNCDDAADVHEKLKTLTLTENHPSPLHHLLGLPVTVNVGASAMKANALGMAQIRFEKPTDRRFLRLLNCTYANLKDLVFFGPFDPKEEVPELVPNSTDHEATEQATTGPTLELAVTPVDDKMLKQADGGFWKGFQVKLDGAPLFAKIINLLPYCEASKRPDARKVVYRDYKMTTMLAEQGLDGDDGITPHFYGLFGCIIENPYGETAEERWQELWCTLYADAGVELAPHCRQDPAIQDRIVGIYTKLHDSGILHNNVKWSHLRCPSANGDGPIKLVDFRRAHTRESFTGSRQPGAFESVRDLELRLVKEIIGLA